MEVRTLKAPKLASKVNLGPRVHCYRPCRQGLPRMEIERIGGGGGKGGVQIVAHNYGHGGGGWTLAPGAVKYVNQLLLEAVRAERPSSDPGQVEIQVVGAGVLGLFTAYDLVKRGHRNVSVLAEHFEELTSHNAGGLLAPFAVKTDDPKWKVLMDKISVDAYNFYAAIARGENVDFAREGAKFLPAYFDVGASGNMERYVRAGVMKPSKRVLVQFEHDDDGQRPSKQQQRQRQMDVYDDGIFIEPHTMMGCLRAFLHSKGVQFVEQRVHSLAELKAPVIVNCTGMGAKQLCQDNRMFSVQGHLFLLKDQIPDNLDYMLVHWVSKGGRTESGQSVDRAVYLFPKRSSSTDPRSVGVLGGTFVANADADTPNNEEFELVLQNAREFFDVQQKEEERAE